MGLLRHLRRFPRVRLNTQVALSTRSGSFGEAGLAYVVDISEGGLGATWPLPPPAAGAHYQIVFYLPNVALPVTALAEVVNPSQAADGHARFGLHLVEISDEAHKLVRRYVRFRRYLYGDLRAPSDNPQVCQRMTERLGRIRKIR